MKKIKNKLLLLPEIPVGPIQCFRSHAGRLLAKGYERVVCGARGAYVEFTREQMVMSNLHIPNNETRRVWDKRYYYVEYRSLCKGNVKVYLQQRAVSYADYKVGFFYISVFDLSTKRFPLLVVDPPQKELPL